MATHKTFNRLHRSVLTTYHLSTLSHSRQYHLLTNPNPNSTPLLNPLRPFSRLERTANSLAGAPGLFYSRSIFTRADDDSEFSEAGGLDVDSMTDLTELVTVSKIADAGLSTAGEESIFLKERKAIGCPSFKWFLPYVCVQVPCFVLWKTTIRRMSLDHHPGFDCGGAFWFQNLTESSRGALGIIFPVLIAALHYTNVQIAFRTSYVKKATGIFDVLVKIAIQLSEAFYQASIGLIIENRHTLPCPGKITTYNMSALFLRGSLLYWATNGSLTCIQQLSLKHPVVHEKLGLPDKDNSSSAADSADLSTPAIAASNKPEKQCKVSVEDLSPKELISLSVQLLSKQDIERAICIIPLLQKQLPAKAIDYLERAISKLMLDGFPTEVESIDHLIIASQWAGAAHSRQGKFREGLVHLERLGKLKEPDDPKIKAHYFDTLFLLSSALYNVGRREEAAEYLRSLTAYDPAYNEFLEQCETEDDSFGSDLANSRRRDY